MSKEIRGKLTVRRTKKGYHAEIHYEKEGKSKRISFPIRDFDREVRELDVVFQITGNRITEIKDAKGTVLWTMREKKKKQAGPTTTEISPRGNVIFPALRSPSSTLKFLKTLWYWNNEFNPSLRFNKFVAYNEKQNKFDYTQTIKKDETGLECIELTDDITRRINLLVKPENYDSNKFLVSSWEGKVQWRIVIGLGSPHVHETAMTWHHTWSIPYIPGSALKGIVRSYYLMETWEKFANVHPEHEWEKTIPCLEAWLMEEPHPTKKVGHKEEECPVIKWAKENLGQEKAFFQTIFGTQKSKGSVIFMDAYPVDKYCLKLDVMNVHYPKYYGDEKQTYAADWESPNPIFFLTVVDTGFKEIGRAHV